MIVEPSLRSDAVWSPIDISRLYQHREDIYFCATAKAVEKIVADHLPKTGQILEVGAGKGYFLDLMPVLARRVIQSDIGIESLRQSGRRTSSVARVHSLPFLDGAFDSIVGFNVFDVIYNLSVAIHECYRVLSPGGKLLVFSDVGPVVSHLYKHYLTLELIPFPKKITIGQQLKFGFQLIPWDDCQAFLELSGNPLLKKYLLGPLSEYYKYERDSTWDIDRLSELADEIPSRMKSDISLEDFYRHRILEAFSQAGFILEADRSVIGAYESSSANRSGKVCRRTREGITVKDSSSPRFGYASIQSEVHVFVARKEQNA